MLYNWDNIYQKHKKFELKMEGAGCDFLRVVIGDPMFWERVFTSLKFENNQNISGRWSTVCLQTLD